MPLARIDFHKGKPVEYVRAVSEAVHRAIVKVLAAPARDKRSGPSRLQPGLPGYRAQQRDHIRADNLVVWPGRGQETGVLCPCRRAAEPEAESASRGRGDQT
jgi:Tautomerase enzyme